MYIIWHQDIPCLVIRSCLFFHLYSPYIPFLLTSRLKMLSATTVHFEIFKGPGWLGIGDVTIQHYEADPALIHPRCKRVTS